MNDLEKVQSDRERFNQAVERYRQTLAHIDQEMRSLQEQRTRAREHVIKMVSHFRKTYGGSLRNFTGGWGTGLNVEAIALIEDGEVSSTENVDRYLKHLAEAFNRCERTLTAEPEPEPEDEPFEDGSEEIVD
jgi:muramoyltetrapeptide carboxypeptidase LdcA involved in peptidoglycan recycling